MIKNTTLNYSLNFEPKKLNISNDSTPTGFVWQSYQGGFGSVYGLGTTNITRKYKLIEKIEESLKKS